MGDFFRGWRRKLGVITLMLACAFMAGWVRSQLSDEGINYQCRKINYAIGSFGGKIQFRRFGPNPEDTYLTWYSMKPTRNIDDNLGVDWNRFNLLWRRDFLYGFHIGVGTHKKLADRTLELLNVPYWSIVIPLTLLSAVLLLSKPRTSNRKTSAVSEPRASSIESDCL